MKSLNIIGALLLVTICCFGQTITMETFLNRLIAVHPYFKAENLSTLIEEEEQSALLGEQDWRLTSSFQFEHDEPDIAFAGPERIDALALNGTLERSFWETGGTFSASYKSSVADIDLPPGTPFPSSFYQNQLAVSYTHPLLKNRNGFLNKLQYELKKFDMDVSAVIATENQENFLRSAAEKYLDWVFFTKQENIIKARLKLSEEELQRAKKKRAANLIDRADVIRAENAVHLWRQNHILVESQGRGIRAELAELARDKRLNALLPEHDIFATIQVGSLEHSKAVLLDSSRLLKVFDVRLRKNDLTRQGFAEAARPDLSAFAQINTKNLDHNFGESLVLDKPSAIVGLQFRITLNNRTAKAKIRKTELQSRQLLERRADLIISLSSALANLHTRIGQFWQILELNRAQITSTQERTAEEKKLYNQGRGELTFVIQSQDSEQNARLTYARNALTYQKLVLEYDALLDRIYNEKDTGSTK